MPKGFSTLLTSASSQCPVNFILRTAFNNSDENFFCCNSSSNFIINKYSPTKIKNNNAGTIYFGIKDLGQCNVALELDDGKLVGTPYGDEGVCARVSSHNN